MATDCGPRDSQQDAAFTRGSNVVAVADGMGGHENGAMAAQVACSSVEMSTLGGVFTGNPEHLIQGAHDRIRAMNTRLGGDAGTTLTAIIFQPDAVLVPWMGDSLAMCVRDGKATLLNWPHNVPGALFHKGRLTESQYRADPERNILIHGCGASFSFRRYVAVWDPAQPGDVYLVMTDGLFDPLGTPGIEAAFKEVPPTYLGDHLMAKAKKLGLTDNATVVVVRT